jgi:hypothetical protein
MNMSGTPSARTRLRHRATPASASRSTPRVPHPALATALYTGNPHGLIHGCAPSNSDSHWIHRATSRSTFATFRWNICNIRLKQTKHLEHTIEIPLQHVKHLDLLLKHLDVTLVIYQRRQMKTLKTCVWNTCNVRVKKIDETLGIYACNIYNILIYFCNIRMKQLKHSSKTDLISQESGL